MGTIPQNIEMLKKLRMSKKMNQINMAEALTETFKVRTGIRHYIQQPDISRLEKGTVAIDVFKLLAYSYLCEADIMTLLHDDYKKLLNPAGSNMQLQEFSTDTDAEQHLIRLEKKQRLLISPNFPATFFKLKKDGVRHQQLGAPSYEANELYTFDSFISFLFSPVGNYSIADKKKVIEDYLSYFQGNNFRQLHFFTRSKLPEHCQLTSVELLPEKQMLLVPGPISHYGGGDSFIEIRDKQIYEKVTQFYRGLPTFENSMLYLRSGLAALDRMRDGSP
ncbi:MAG: Unknown protein, partial [uncultured Thiotrichaceae bacterium]